MFRSIRWRTAAAFVALILVCILGLSLYLSHFFEDSYLENLKVQLADQARLVADSGTSYVSSGQGAASDALAKRLGEQIDARITIIASDGMVLGDSDEDPAAMENHSDRPEVIDALVQGTGSSIRHSSTLGLDMMYVAVPVVDGGQVVGIARVSLPLTEIHDSVGHVNVTIAWTALVAAFLAILVAVQLSKVTVTPIKELTDVSRRMAAGQLDQEIDVTSVDEVGELARSFNLMAARIKEMVAIISTERDRLAVTLSNIGDGIVVVDGDSRVTLVNRAAETMLHIPKGDAAGRSFVSLVRDYELDNLLQRCLRTREQQTGMVETSPRKRALGVSATPLKENPGCLLLIRDLTELRRLETVRRDFVSNISHELRTPLATLKALAETLREGALDDPLVAKSFLGKMNTEVDRLAQMVEELGELSRIESGEAPVQMEPFDAASTLEQAAARLRPQAERAGVRLDTSIPSDLPRAIGDREKVERVLVNLIHNAIKFTDAGGSITVSVETDGGSLRVSVTDTGVGIPADDLPRIFERFYKADKARSGSGTGLGLAIAKHIVEAHGGAIRAHSTEGKGSVFSFTLPLFPGP